MGWNRKHITPKDNTLKMISIEPFQHQILCLVSIIIITSGLDNFLGFPFISDTKEMGEGKQTIAINIPEGGVSSETFDLHCFFLWLLKTGNKLSFLTFVPWK